MSQKFHKLKITIHCKNIFCIDVKVYLVYSGEVENSLAKGEKMKHFFYVLWLLILLSILQLFSLAQDKKDILFIIFTVIGVMIIMHKHTKIKLWDNTHFFSINKKDIYIFYILNFGVPFFL